MIVDVNAVDVNAVDLNAVDVNAVDIKGVLGEATAHMHSPISETDLRTRFAQNLRNLRNSQKISQEGLADLAGVHRTFVSQVERGLRNLSLDNMLKLANALKVDPVEFFRPEQD